MVKLNFERDVLPLAKQVGARMEREYTVINSDGTWEVYGGAGALIRGTLREAYSFLLGIKHATENSR